MVRIVAIIAPTPLAEKHQAAVEKSQDPSTHRRLFRGLARGHERATSDTWGFSSNAQIDPDVGFHNLRRDVFRSEPRRFPRL
jgi:hypothetical protein